MHHNHTQFNTFDIIYKWNNQSINDNTIDCLNNNNNNNNDDDDDDNDETKLKQKININQMIVLKIPRTFKQKKKNGVSTKIFNINISMQKIQNTKDSNENNKTN